LLNLTSNFYGYHIKWVPVTTKTVAGIKKKWKYTNKRGNSQGVILQLQNGADRWEFPML